MKIVLSSIIYILICLSVFLQTFCSYPNSFAESTKRKMIGTWYRVEWEQVKEEFDNDIVISSSPIYSCTTTTDYVEFDNFHFYEYMEYNSDTIACFLWNYWIEWEETWYHGNDTIEGRNILVRQSNIGEVRYRNVYFAGDTMVLHRIGNKFYFLPYQGSLPPDHWPKKIKYVEML